MRGDREHDKDPDKNRLRQSEEFKGFTKSRQVRFYGEVLPRTVTSYAVVCGYLQLSSAIS